MHIHICIIYSMIISTLYWFTFMFMFIFVTKNNSMEVQDGKVSPFSDKIGSYIYFCCSVFNVNMTNVRVKMIVVAFYFGGKPSHFAGIPVCCMMWNLTQRAVASAAAGWWRQTLCCCLITVNLKLLSRSRWATHSIKSCFIITLDWWLSVSQHLGALRPTKYSEYWTEFGWWPVRDFRWVKSYSWLFLKSRCEVFLLEENKFNIKQIYFLHLFCCFFNFTTEKLETLSAHEDHDMWSKAQKIDLQLRTKTDNFTTMMTLSSFCVCSSKSREDERPLLPGSRWAEHQASSTLVLVWWWLDSDCQMWISCSRSASNEIHLRPKLNTRGVCVWVWESISRVISQLLYTTASI